MHNYVKLSQQTHHYFDSFPLQNQYFYPIVIVKHKKEFTDPHTFIIRVASGGSVKDEVTS